MRKEGRIDRDKMGRRERVREREKHPQTGWYTQESRHIPGGD